MLRRDVPQAHLPRPDRHPASRRPRLGLPRVEGRRRSGPTLVEELLRSPEYVDYWAYKWSDLLLVSSKTLPAPAMWAFYRSIREAVAENLPWDKFARRILTAKGSTLTDGAANYFVLHRDPIELSDNVSMAFLGMSLTCARCHNHPMEKWTQDQYYGMANLFSRVALKDGATPRRGDRLARPRRRPDPPPQGGRHGPAAAGRRRPSSPSDRRDRREAFADWLSGPENPYFDRAIVNRVWRNFFGRGLIEPEDDLRASNPASDEALLAWLVADFRGHGRDLKHLIRTIANSAAYSRSSEPVPGQRGGREVPQPLHGQAAAGRGPAGRDRPRGRRAHAVRRLPRRLADACSCPTPRSPTRSSPRSAAPSA